MLHQLPYSPWVNSVLLYVWCTINAPAAFAWCTINAPAAFAWCTINAPAAFAWCTINAPAAFAWCTNHFVHKVEFSYIGWNGVHPLWYLSMISLYKSILSYHWGSTDGIYLWWLTDICYNLKLLFFLIGFCQNKLVTINWLTFQL